MPALAVVEEGAEDAWRIEIWQAAPIDGAVLADEGNGAQVANDAVVVDGQVAHRSVWFQGGPPSTMKVALTACSTSREA